MAEHILLSSIFDVINKLANPSTVYSRINRSQSSQDNTTAPFINSVNCLRDLSDGKILSKFIKKRHLKTIDAKEDLTNTIYSYLSINYHLEAKHRVNLQKIIDNWTDLQMINFIVLFADHIKKFKVYNVTVFKRLSKEFDCILKYYDEALENCLNMSTGIPVEPLIDVRFLGMFS
jgi:hypothetical protein